MDLKLKQAAELLCVPEKTVLKWISEKRIRAYKLYNQYRFNRNEICEWILKGKIQVSEEVLKHIQSEIPVNITRLITNGGIYNNIGGDSPETVIKNAVELINLPADLNKDRVLQNLMEREEMMTTAIGKGIALPHPRTPILSDIKNESISICLLEKPTDFKSLDGEFVHSMFIILSANPRHHLEILSKISLLCSQSKFINMLYEKNSTDEIIKYIQFKEQEWRNK